MKPGTEPDRIYLQHMLECIARIEEYVGGDEQRLCESRLIQDAVVRNLQTLAESSQRLSGPTKNSEPNIPWRAISGFRNILVHDYLGIDVSAIWQVVAVELAPLRAALVRMFEKLSHGE